jgi:hypothetical protein
MSKVNLTCFSNVQYPVLYLSRLQMICHSRQWKLTFNLARAALFVDGRYHGHVMILDHHWPIRTHAIIKNAHITTFQHGFWLRGAALRIVSRVVPTVQQSYPVGLPIKALAGQ